MIGDGEWITVLAVVESVHQTVTATFAAVGCLRREIRERVFLCLGWHQIQIAQRKLGSEVSGQFPAGMVDQHLP